MAVTDRDIPTMKAPPVGGAKPPFDPAKIAATLRPLKAAAVKAMAKSAFGVEHSELAKAGYKYPADYKRNTAGAAALGGVAAGDVVLARALSTQARAGIQRLHDPSGELMHTLSATRSPAHQALRGANARVAGGAALTLGSAATLAAIGAHKSRHRAAWRAQVKAERASARSPQSKSLVSDLGRAVRGGYRSGRKFPELRPRKLGDFPGTPHYDYKQALQRKAGETRHPRAFIAAAEAGRRAGAGADTAVANKTLLQRDAGIAGGMMAGAGALGVHNEHARIKRQKLKPAPRSPQSKSAFGIEHTGITKASFDSERSRHRRQDVQAGAAAGGSAATGVIAASQLRRAGRMGRLSRETAAAGRMQEQVIGERLVRMSSPVGTKGGLSNEKGNVRRTAQMMGDRQQTRLAAQRVGHVAARAARRGKVAGAVSLGLAGAAYGINRQERGSGRSYGYR